MYMLVPLRYLPRSGWYKLHLLVSSPCLKRMVSYPDHAYYIREFGIREISYVNYRVAVGLLEGQGCERSELPCLSDVYNPTRP